LLKSSKHNKVNIIQVSPGLAFSCLKFKPLSLYKHLSNRDPKAIVNKSGDQIKDIVLRLMKTDSSANSIIFNQLLYDSHSDDKNVPGTVPLFWQQIDIDYLKDIYFGQTALMTIFNPVHLIHEVEKRGFLVESDYYKNQNQEIKGKKGITVILFYSRCQFLLRIFQRQQNVAFTRWDHGHCCWWPNIKLVK
jgi:hypothetical protein